MGSFSPTNTHIYTEQKYLRGYILLFSHSPFPLSVFLFILSLFLFFLALILFLYCKTSQTHQTYIPLPPKKNVYEPTYSNLDPPTTITHLLDPCGLTPHSFLSLSFAPHTCPPRACTHTQMPLRERLRSAIEKELGQYLPQSKDPFGLLVYPFFFF